MKTIACLPDIYNGHLTIDINDWDETVVARNLIMLWIALNFPPESASTAILHFWYSAFLPLSIAESIRNQILPIIESHLGPKPAGSAAYSQSSWSQKNVTLRATLPKKGWERLKSYLPGAPTVSFHDGVELRKSVTLAHERRDYRDRALFRLPPSWRLSQLKYRKDGVLLPFGASRESFKIPNP